MRGKRGMRTVYQLLVFLNACKRAQKKYRKGRAFKAAFVNAHWQDAAWLGTRLFSPYHCSPRPTGIKYPEFPFSYFIDHWKIGIQFQTKENRIEYWPVVKRRLVEIGVKL